MLRSFRIGKLFGIPLYVHSTFVLLPLWMLVANRGLGPVGALLMLIWLAGLFTCVVLHELGHALMARFFGIGTASITLYPIGGVARLQRMSEKPGEEIAIALAGPAINLVLAVLLAPAAFLALWGGAILPGELFSPDQGALVVLGQFLVLLWSANVFMLLFNLLPCFPMDGGRVLRALLTFGTGRLRATEMSVKVGLVMAILIACLSPLLMSPMPLILAVFVFLVGQAELAGVRQLEARRRSVRPVPEAAPVELSMDEGFYYRPHASFTGVVWDGRSRLWVRWHNGHPVAYWG